MPGIRDVSPERADPQLVIRSVAHPGQGPAPGQGVGLAPARLAEQAGAGRGAPPQASAHQPAHPVPTQAAVGPATSLDANLPDHHVSMERRWFKAIALVSAAVVGGLAGGPVGAAVLVGITAMLLDRSEKNAAAQGGHPGLAAQAGLQAQPNPPVAAQLQQPPHAPPQQFHPQQFQAQPHPLPQPRHREVPVPPAPIPHLLQLPPAVWAERLKAIEGKLPGSSPTGG